MAFGAWGVLPAAVLGLAAQTGGGLAPGQVPVERTPYGRALFRFEGRTSTPELDAGKRQAAEAALAKAGIQARWLEMVDTSGSPLLDTPFLPGPGPQAAANEAALKAWVVEVHAQGMTALSWYPLTFCRAGYIAHPEWRQKFIEPYPVPGEEQLYCCINTGYGDALVRYCVEGVRRLNLDGIWFDGSVWTGIWQVPYPLSCKCDACRSRFRRDTGMELPDKLDWNSPAFRRWVSWRFEVFGAFIGKLAAAIRTAKPGAAVVINHYHRPGVPWRSAVPLDRYSADIVTGSEAFSVEQADLTTRLCRAYGRSQSEVWRPLDVPGEPAVNAEPLVQHALVCFAAGGVPSFGGDPFNSRTAPTAAVMSPIVNAVGSLSGGRSLSPVAIHVSQQTETFHYARGDSPSSASVPFWSSLQAWTMALGEGHLAPDCIFDRDFTPTTLARYRVVSMPLSVSLSDSQATTALAFARAGGTLLLGCGAGTLAADGQRHTRRLLEEALGYAGSGAPRPDGSDTSALKLKASDGVSFSHYGVRKPVRFTSAAWKTRMWADGAPCMAERTYGTGRAIVLDTDVAVATGRTMVGGGRTSITYTKDAASGKWAARFRDDPIAPASYYPDMETRLPYFGTPTCSGGALDLDVRLGRDAQVSIELRSSRGALEGPIVGLGAGGKALADGQPVCDVPTDGWCHYRIAFDYAAGGNAGVYTLTVTLPDGDRHEARRPTANPAFRGMDWFVVYGPGTAAGTFDVDNVVLSRRLPDGRTETALRYDFEEGPAGQSQPTLLGAVTDLLRERIQGTIRVEAPSELRAGIFRTASGAVRVHLHNRNGLVAGFATNRGPSAVIVTPYPVRSAKRLIRHGSLAVARRGSGSAVTVGGVGLYEVVELRR